MYLQKVGRPIYKWAVRDTSGMPQQVAVYTGDGTNDTQVTQRPKAGNGARTVSTLVMTAMQVGKVGEAKENGA